MRYGSGAQKCSAGLGGRAAENGLTNSRSLVDIERVGGILGDPGAAMMMEVIKVVVDEGGR